VKLESHVGGNYGDKDFSLDYIVLKNHEQLEMPTIKVLSK
jgi:hypothetical protein